MNLYKTALFRLHYKHWTCLEAIAYFVKGTARELGIAPSFFLKLYRKILTRSFLKKWLKISDDEFYFDFKGVKLPYVPNSTDKLQGIISCFDDVFLIPCYFDDNYNKSIAEFVDRHTDEGPYGYSDGYFDVTVKKDDVVIDAGAWIGDFSAYAASKGATVYAFEPVNDTFQLLRKTQSLNNIKEGGIYPIQKGLGDRECEMDISINEVSSGGNSIVTKRDDISVKERISITTLDRFVEENKLERVDFIKSDIEGAERDMLRGAANVLKTFAPKLAICTYHLPDDPNVLENIIKEANPAYTVVHLKHKLFAAVVNK